MNMRRKEGRGVEREGTKGQEDKESEDRQAAPFIGQAYLALAK